MRRHTAGSVNFVEDETDDDFISVEFSEAGGSHVRPGIFDQIMLMLRDLRDQKPETPHTPEKNNRSFKEQLLQTSKQEQEFDMTEKDKVAEKIDFAEREVALVKRERVADERDKALADAADKASLKASKEFAESLVSDGKILPRDRDAVAQLLHVLPNEATVNFAEGDAEQVKDDKASTFLRDFLTRLPIQVDYAERSASNSDSNKDSIDIRVPSEFAVDNSQIHQHQKILNYAEKHNTTYIEAIPQLGNSL